MVRFVVEKPQIMSASQNIVVSETTMSSIIPNNNNNNNNSSSQKLPPCLISISKKKLLKNIDIINGGGQRINAWVDSMRASSPTHLKSLPSSISTQQQLNSWIMQHPSALEKFEQIMEASRGKQIVMFLDYDGTLSPIVDDPDKAFMSSKMRRTVKKLAKCFPTAIVTGRCIDKVYNFVKLAELYYAGSHGMDIKGPAKGFSRHKRVKQSLLYQPANDYLPMIDEVYRQLLEKTKSTPGAKVENHKFCASVHFRCVDEKKWSELVLQVRSVLKKFPTLQLTQGRKVFEIRPMIEWDKGKALEFLLESLGFGNTNNVFPVYIGDDRTDEDAFKMLRDRGEGFGILVSKFPKDTDASYSLQDPSEVMDFLRRLVEWKQMQPRM
ncbi:putative trehalose-phosphate phosphatase I [Arabidopsis thaliana]|jgi:trehalose 6-phosphate phosphatase|nr:Haloacid dehalogenase-like hydrolase (HAD) superfamily protein [Arabidopsis thaliana]AED91493.2 Haloacid dehalogenase-like hydrolase (HAD) superfamily protein [Arabidopsis thaliana]KAG7601779.1 HAD-like superfamily [Arabidopsis thaliana x Arabidopsis arenosa]OAO91765.1 TPPI [Arabidopsis thaliana]|eukprot:NP_001318525.1 Haloacid dehalogenase-like hydrolase (HAD) superfamily protein [Arabidopsis thaliana]